MRHTCLIRAERAVLHLLVHLREYEFCTHVSRVLSFERNMICIVTLITFEKNRPSDTALLKDAFS